MKRLLFLTLLCSVFAGGNANAAVVNFDDLDTATTGSISVPLIYKGFQWGAINPSFTAINDAHWTGAGNYNNSVGAPSGPNGVLNSGIVNITRSDNSVFNFLGAYFSPFTSNSDINSQGSTALNVFVEGYNGANLVNTATIAFSAAGYVWLQADLIGVTSLSIYGTSPNPAIQPFQTGWLMDDFTYEPTSSTVPEPAPIWLFISTLAGLAVFGKRSFLRTPA
ncbi:MAG: hypothetical protein NTV43_13690 [Methylococcales bacterium]|nr:hypothetical protein [Methylococcales bacterium]